MRRALKWIGIALGAVLLVAGVLLAGAVWMGERKLKREVLVKIVPVRYAAADPVALKYGRYVYDTRGCVSCHGPDGSGKVMINDGGMFVRTPNITQGPGSVVAEYTEADWVRAIRHGVDPRGRALMIMPSELYSTLSDADLAAMIAYIRSLPPIAGERATVRLPVVMKALYGVGVIRDASEKIAHSRSPRPVASTVSATPEHGSYVAQMCMGCHGDNLTGGHRDGPPHGPIPANLTPGEGTVMARYDTPEKFAAMMRSGKRPDGTEVRMPFDSLAAFNDTDLAAMYAYLKTLPPKPTGAR